MSKNIVVFGAGGHSKVVADIAELNSYTLVGFVDPFATRSEFINRPIFKNILDIPAGDYFAVVALGDNSQRSRVAQEIMDHQGVAKFTFITLIHPAATVSKSSTVGKGTVVMAGAVINPYCQIGDHVIVNTGSIVDHDCILKNFASVAPGAVLGGNVRIMEHSVVSIGAICRHNIEIAPHSVVGANSYVNKNVPENSVVYGVPAKVVRTRKLGDKYL